MLANLFANQYQSEMNLMENETSTKELYLQAEERITELESQLLHAHELIVHLIVSFEASSIGVWAK